MLCNMGLQSLPITLMHLSKKAVSTNIKGYSQHQHTTYKHSISQILFITNFTSYAPTSSTRRDCTKNISQCVKQKMHEMTWAKICDKNKLSVASNQSSQRLNLDKTCVKCKVLPGPLYFCSPQPMWVQRQKNQTHTNNATIFKML